MRKVKKLKKRRTWKVRMGWNPPHADGL